ncbi:MAG: DUF4347 domain-containing protein [Oculatellaceae cyanobacterium Prado106]|nr:DUF4347 domain-containing protein [Oculatellaceae cyanobacterium Prado106]
MSLQLPSISHACDRSRLDPNPESSLVIIDTSVRDMEYFVAQVEDRFQVVFLTGDRDGLEQITEILAQHPDVEQVHLITHGSPGCLRLGNSQLDRERSLQSRALIQQWFQGSRLQENRCPALLIYACQVAAGAIGEAFLETLHEVTGVAIAASRQLLGNAEGGTGELDGAIGFVPVLPLFSAECLRQYSGVLELPSLSINDLLLVEGDSGSTNAVFTVTLSEVSSQTVTVDYDLSELTATVELDYVPSSGTLTFNPGDLTQTILVPINGDLVAESNETFRVSLLSATNANLATTQGIGTLVDDDSASPQIFTNNRVVTEGNSGSTSVTFTVLLTEASSLPITVNYTTNNFSALNTDNDYTPTSGTLTFAPDETAKTVTVSVNGDPNYEINESFTLDFSSATNASIANSRAFGTINNDDPLPTVSISPATLSALEGNSGTTAYTFTVSLSHSSSQPVFVFYNTLDGTASLAGGDYLDNDGTLIFSPGGSLTQTITVLVNGDDQAEANETLIVELTSVYQGILSATNNQSIVTITNDDTPGITLTPLSTTAREGGITGSYELVLNSQPTSPVTITLNTGSQIDAIAPLTFNSTNWNIPQTVAIIATDDLLQESIHSGTITHTVTSIDPDYNNFLINPVNVTILDNDTPGVTLTPSGSSVEISEDGIVDSYEINLETIPSSSVGITLTADSQSLVSLDGVNFAPTQTVNLDDLDPETIFVKAIDDRIAESLHTSVISHAITTTAPGYPESLAIAPLTAQITDNDIGGISIIPTGGRTVVSEAGLTDTYLALLTSQPTQNVILTITPDQELVTSPQFLTFTPTNWNVAQSITVSAVEDSVVEDAIPFHFGLIRHSTATSPDPAYQTIPAVSTAVSIADNDRNTSPALSTPICPPGKTLKGNRNRNRLKGTSGADTLNGKGDHDQLQGFDCDDTLIGGKGNDRILGGSGDDRLIGGLGSDRLIGGTGSDRFVFQSVKEGSDRIPDFDLTADFLDFRPLFQTLAPSANPLQDYLRLSPVGTGTLVSIHIPGKPAAGLAKKTAIVTLDNIRPEQINATHFWME